VTSDVADGSVAK